MVNHLGTPVGLAWVPRPILVDNKELEERAACWRSPVRSDPPLPSNKDATGNGMPLLEDSVRQKVCTTFWVENDLMDISITDKVLKF
jgi:hypothetical protein